MNGSDVGHGEGWKSSSACEYDWEQGWEQDSRLSLLTAGWRYRMYSVIELHGPPLHATDFARCGAELTFGTLVAMTFPNFPVHPYYASYHWLLITKPTESDLKKP